MADPLAVIQRDPAFAIDIHAQQRASATPRKLDAEQLASLGLDPRREQLMQFATFCVHQPETKSGLEAH